MPLDGGGGDAISSVSSSTSSSLIGGIGAGVAGVLLLVGACLGRRYVRSKGVLALRRAERKPLPARKGYHGAIMMPIAPLSVTSMRHKQRKPRASKRLTQLLNPCVNVRREKKKQQALLLSAIGGGPAPPFAASGAEPSGTHKSGACTAAANGAATLEKSPPMPTTAAARPRRPTGVNYSFSGGARLLERGSTADVVVAERTSNAKEAQQRLSQSLWREASRESVSNRIEPMLIEAEPAEPSSSQPHGERGKAPVEDPRQWKPAVGVVSSLRLASSVVRVPDCAIAVTSAAEAVRSDGGLRLHEVAVIVDKPIDITAAAVAQQGGRAGAGIRRANSMMPSSMGIRMSTGGPCAGGRGALGGCGGGGGAAGSDLSHGIRRTMSLTPVSAATVVGLENEGPDSPGQRALRAAEHAVFRDAQRSLSLSGRSFSEARLASADGEKRGEAHEGNHDRASAIGGSGGGSSGGGGMGGGRGERGSSPRSPSSPRLPSTLGGAAAELPAEAWGIGPPGSLTTPAGYLTPPREESKAASRAGSHQASPPLVAATPPSRRSPLAQPSSSSPSPARSSPTLAQPAAAAAASPVNDGSLALPPPILESAGVRERAKLFAQQTPQSPGSPQRADSAACDASAGGGASAARARASLALRGPGSTRSCAALFEQKQREGAAEAKGGRGLIGAALTEPGRAEPRRTITLPRPSLQIQ